MQEKDIYAEISSIRSLMERSSKFISLSGLSGVMAGVYALAGAIAGYRIVYGGWGKITYRNYYVNDPDVFFKLTLIAVLVLALSIITALVLTSAKAKKKNETVWNPVSKKLLWAASIPLVTGGLFSLIMMAQGSYGVVCSVCLIFYGLALTAASQFTFNDVKWLGLCEIALGLVAALFPGYGLIFWTLGFSILHIIYGTVMHFKYDR